jgi:protein-S-isoprenylcysteine O-methyltransferase Ste14
VSARSSSTQSTPSPSRPARPTSSSTKRRPLVEAIIPWNGDGSVLQKAHAPSALKCDALLADTRCVERQDATGLGERRTSAAELRHAGSSLLGMILGLGERRVSAAELRHVGSSLLGMILWLSFTFAHVSASIHAGRVIGLGLGLLELLTAVLFLARRAPDRVSTHPTDWVVAFIGTFGSMLLRPGGPVVPAMDAFGLAVQGAGLLLAMVSIGVLRRSFGIVPADRGVVTAGPYRIVRHPVYASYVIAQIGYLMQSPRLWNFGVVAVTWACQVRRIVGEERLLGSDPEYQALQKRTRYRLVPGLW